MATVSTLSTPPTADSAIDPVEMLPGIDVHPHARAVLVPALPSAPGLDGASVRPPVRSPSHAYLLHGPSGAGKRAIARAFAAALLAEGYPDEETARAARERAMRGSHPDLTWVSPERGGGDAGERHRRAGRGSGRADAV